MLAEPKNTESAETTNKKILQLQHRLEWVDKSVDIRSLRRLEESRARTLAAYHSDLKVADREVALKHDERGKRGDCIHGPFVEVAKRRRLRLSPPPYLLKDAIRANNLREHLEFVSVTAVYMMGLIGSIGGKVFGEAVRNGLSHSGVEVDMHLKGLHKASNSLISNLDWTDCSFSEAIDELEANMDWLRKFLKSLSSSISTRIFERTTSDGGNERLHGADSSVIPVLISQEEAARLADVSSKTIRSWIKKGYLVAHGERSQVDRNQLADKLDNGELPLRNPQTAKGNRA